MSKKNGRVWLLTQTHDDLVADKPDTEDLLQPGEAFATQEAAKKAAQREFDEYTAELQKEADAEHAAELRHALALCKTEKARVELRLSDKWSSPVGIVVTRELLWAEVKGGVYSTDEGRHWFVSELEVNES